MVIGRGTERYVTELALDHTEPMRVDERTQSTQKLVAWMSQSSASTSSLFHIGAPIPMEQRKRDFIPRIVEVE